MKQIIMFVCLLCLVLPAKGNDGMTETSPADSTGREYRNVLFLRVNKGKGYKKQAFEQDDAYALIERGVSFVGFNVGFRSNDIDDYWLEPLAVVDEVYNRNFSATLALGYVVKNNLSIGLKGSYSFSDTRLTIDADLFDLLFSAKTYETNNAEMSYSVAGVVKNFIPLDRAHRMFLVNETNLGYNYTHSLAKNIYDGGVKIHKIEKVKNSVSIGISPGFMYFMTKGLAFDFALNPVIAYYEKTSITNYPNDAGSVNNYGLSFKFMPFNIQFGFSYYFGLDYERNKKHIEAVDREDRHRKW